MPVCAQCGEEHPLNELELSFRRPDAVVEISGPDRASRVQESNDLCVIDGSRFFVRAVLPLPVESRDRPYNLGLWSEVDRTTFERIYQLWSEPTQVRESPFPARLANALPNHRDTLRLSATLCLTGPTTRPRLVLEATAHTLFTEQSLGITEHRAHEYSSLFARGAV
jgi:hypothetical protein